MKQSHNRGTKMPKTSIQDLLLEEVRQLREDTKQIREEAQKHSNILTRVSTVMDAVEVQTTKTNGRVTRVEARLNIQKGGIFVAYVFIVLIAIPLFIAFLKQ